MRKLTSQTLLMPKVAGGGSLEKVKISEVSGYIDSIEQGSDNDPRIINITTDVNSDFATADVQAVQGDITIKGQLQNSKGTLEVPKDGKWTVSAPNVVGAVPADVDFPVQTKDVLLTSKCTATVKIHIESETHSKTDSTDFRVYLYTPYQQVGNVTLPKNTSIIDLSFNAPAFGKYVTSVSGALEKYFKAQQSFNITKNKDYTFNWIRIYSSTSFYPTNDPNNQEQPSIGDDMINSENNNYTAFFYETTDLTPEQEEEFRKTIEEMAKDNKSQSEIEDYIASKEQEYSNSI